MPRGVPKSGKTWVRRKPKPKNPNETQSQSTAKPVSAAEKLANKIVKTEISTELKNLLCTDTKEHKPYYQVFLKRFLEEAARDPNSKAAILLATSMFKDNLLDSLDNNTRPPVDIPYLSYQLSLQCFDKQLDVLHCAKYNHKICMMTSRRGGKSTTDVRLMVAFSLITDSPILYVGLTRNAGIEQTFDDVLTLCSAIGLTGVKPDRRGGRIEFSNGSFIKYAGNRTLPEQEDLRGGKYRLIIIDECQSQRMLHNLIDNVLRPTLADYPDSVLVLSGTPPRVKKTYFENAWNSGAYKNFHWTAADNPFMPDWEATIDDVCKEKGLTRDDPLIQREYYGRLVYDTTALIFSNFKTYKAEIVSGSYLPENPLDPAVLTSGVRYALPEGFIPEYLYVGVDWGFSDKYSSCLIACSITHRQAYVIYEAKDMRKASSVVIDSVKDGYAYAMDLKVKFPQCRLIEVYGDTNEEALLMELAATYSMPARKAYKIDKNTHMDILADLCRTGVLLVPEGGCCADEMERTVHPRDDTGAMLPGVDDDAFHPDMLDSLLYGTRKFMYDLGMEGAKFNEEKTKMETIDA